MCLNQINSFNFGLKHVTLIEDVYSHLTNLIWMLFHLVLVASAPQLPKSIVNAVTLILEENGYTPTRQTWLSQDKALEITLDDTPNAQTHEKLLAILHHAKIDHFLVPDAGRRKRLLVADMDSTIAAEETLDEIARACGVGDQVAEITKRSMRGEVDFNTSLRNRVALLAGQPAQTLASVRAMMKLNEGAKTFVKTMAAHGAKCVLISGGFTYFTSFVAEICGFHHDHGNVLEMKNGRITGFLEEPILGPQSKADLLREYCTKYKIQESDALAIGDGANDKNMLTMAGMGIGYYPKDVLRPVTPHHITFTDLKTALYIQGYRDDEIYVEQPLGFEDD